jgi:ornithine cyclodeaminase/alanine dehydrogenase-like protein (mu-crystallin family)
MLVLGEADVRRLLPMADCVDLMAETLEALARGELYQPLRVVFRPPDAGSLMGLMPSYRSGERSAWALKAICIFPDNPKRGLDAHQGGVLLQSGETGELLAMLNASAVTEIRTAAVSAVATRALAREDARVCAILGSGVQGRSHVEAMRNAGRDFDEIRVWSRTPENAQALAAQWGLTASGSVEEALDGADVVCTTTTAREPIVQRSWLAPGAHVNAVGSSIPTTRELDTATIADSALFVDRRESTENEAGDYLFPLREGAIGPDHIRAELGDVLLGSAPGRSSDDELTVFKSLGIGVEDLASAELVYRRAREQGLGVEVEF